MGFTNFLFLIYFFNTYIGRYQAAFSVLHLTMPTAPFQTALRVFQSIRNMALSQLWQVLRTGESHGNELQHKLLAARRDAKFSFHYFQPMLSER